jgi:hypothetical protein
MRRLLFVVICAGCAADAPSDLDSDGVSDLRDTCFAGIKDEAIDVDGDGKDATQDLCPHDYNAMAGDGDEDGIPEACDPFVGAAAPDTRRCVTSFGVRWMNASHFVARAGEQLWNLNYPITATGGDNVSMVSNIEYPYRSTTYDVLGRVHFRDADSGSSFKIWLRAVEDPSNQDVACGIDGSNNLFVWANNTRQAVRPLPVAIDGEFRLRATVQSPTTTSSILCRVTANGMSVATTLDASLRPGRFGFAAIATDVTIDSLVIDTNDIAPPI